MSEIDYTKIRDKRIRAMICDLMSEMLDNPDKSGIYPTSRFMWKMETFILDENARLRKAIKRAVSVMDDEPAREWLEKALRGGSKDRKVERSNRCETKILL